ncbi:protein crumbs homolog 3 isoform X1 [Lepidochelys kempii]|uniref:protein crumbs homolog 3 isoform X1 n=1 Tax=Lepidochelys kempii TaxID=8472 RepID=UPI003C6FACB1
MSSPPSQTPGGAMAGYSHPLLLAVALQSLLQLALGQVTNGSTATPTPASGLTESERLAAIIVPSLVGGLLLIGLVIFGALKVRERRQTEGTYRPSNEEQQASERSAVGRHTLRMAVNLGAVLRPGSWDSSLTVCSILVSDS